MGLASDLFVSDGLTVFAFIQSHVRKHGVVPNLATIKTDTGIDIVDPAPEPLTYYAEKLFERKRLAVQADQARDLVDHLKNEDSKKVADSAKKLIVESNKWQFGKHVYGDPRQTIDDRVRRQIELEKLHGVIDGYPTPWPELDQVTRGIHNGEFWIIVAAKKTGKTWCLLLFFEKLLREHRRPLLVSMEMPTTSMERRLDAIYSTLDYREFREGTLGVDGIDKYIERMKALAKEEIFWTAGNGQIKTPADVELLARELNPGVILIDGVYLMQPSSGHWGSKYEKVSTVADEIQPMSLRLQKPILMTTQFNRKLKQGSLSGDSGMIGYAYELAQNADLALALYRDDDMKESKQMIVSIMEHREGEDFNMYVRWDLSEMNFDFIRQISTEELNGDDKASGGSASKVKF